MTNSDMPAMPQEWEAYVEAAPSGLTKREHFAGLAMQSILAADTDQSYSSGLIARQATEVADALLSALEQDQAK